ncbi:MAG: hypothetical protein DWQ01_07095 [Planctomycetota bacterium]|nr:MAG: hypothetical protein DWQ01_07095 [Planctomycetota bacterium]
MSTEQATRVSEQVRAFCQTHLGPASEEAAAAPETQALILHHLRQGKDLEDAVLTELHRLAPKNRALADEFLSFFLQDLHRAGQFALRPGLQRFLETGDLVQSVLGDIWTELTKLRFESRDAFRAYLRQRLRWKASDHDRRLHRAKRSEGRRVEEQPEELGAPAPGPSPATLVGSREEQELLILALARLPERDREILRRHLRGENHVEVANSLGLGENQARKALQRAIRRASRLLRPSPDA